MNKDKVKKMNMDACESIAREATRKRLENHPLPEAVRKNLALGASLEGDHWIFELYVPGERPQDARFIARTKVHRITGECEVDILPETVGQ